MPESICSFCNGEKEINGVHCEACLGTGLDLETGSSRHHGAMYAAYQALTAQVVDLQDRYDDLLDKYNDLKEDSHSH